MKKNEPISKVMSTDLITLHHGEPVSRARKLMVEHDVHHLPVVSGSELVGVISWSDILRLSFADALGSDDRAVDATLDHSFTLEQVMSADPITLSAQHGTVREAAEILATGKFHALPVVDGGRLVGLVTSSDLLRYLADLY
jgi:CBS domain-containing protein